MSNWLVKRLLGIASVAMLLLAAQTVAAAPGGESQAAWRAARGGTPAKGAPRVQAAQQARNGRSVQTLVYRFARPEILLGADGVADINVPGTDLVGDPGEPLLPVLGIRVVVPQGHEVVAVKVTPGKSEVVAEQVQLRHAEAAYPLSRPELAGRRTPRSERIYGSNARFPARCEVRNGLQRKRGVPFEELQLYPVSYQPKSGRVSWTEQITVEVETAPAAAALATGKGGRPGYARLRSERDLQAAQALVDNPATLAAYTISEPSAVPLEGDDPPPPPPPPPAPGEEEEEVPTLPCQPTDNGGTGYVHVVITTVELSEAFNGLVSRRKNQGITSKLVTLDEILAAYPGNDTQESIREFIRDAYNTWGTEYVLLGGDSGQIPPRMLFVSANGGTETDTLPSDLYYQCLDGTFNGNNNQYWGEPDDGPNGQDVDLYAEVAIGRVAAETPQEVSNWLGKVAVYEADCAAGSAQYVRSALFVGEHLGFGGVSDYATGMMEQIRMGSTADGYTTKGFAPFDKYTYTETLYDRPGYEWSGAEFAELANANRFAVVNHLGHSNVDYNMKLRNGEVDDLFNSKPFFVYSQGCIAGAFDYDCIAEHFTTSTGSGAFAGVWNARYGWGSGNSTDGPSQRFNRHFWNACFADGIPHLGVANKLSHERNAPIINRNCIRWCYYETNLFGDPIQIIDGFDTTLELDREAYQSTAEAVVTLRVPPQYGLGAQSVRLSLDEGGLGGLDVDCPFAGMENRRAVYRSAPVSLTLLSASHGQTLYAIWTEGDKRAEAAIDDVPPQILNARVDSPDDDMLRVTWTTDEPASGGIRAGTSLPPGEHLRSHASYTTTHDLSIDGLPPFSLYAVAVWAEDKAGNRAELPADPSSTDMADYMIHSTVARQVRARFDLERSAEGCLVQDLSTNACWEYGTPTYGPAVASRCWGTRLNGRYPDGAHAILSSPPVTVGVSPVISFRHWYDIEQTPPFRADILNADCGYVEVYANGAWHDVGAYARPALAGGIVAGQSDGWQETRILLPASFANQTLKIRFRFVSDAWRAGPGNPAGWYIDGVTFSDFPAKGLTLATLEIDDAAPGGNANNCAEPGETFNLRLGTFNYGATDITIREGSFVLQTGGGEAGRVTLAGGSPAILTYGTLTAGQMTESQPYVVQVSPLTRPGTVVTVLQTLTGTDGTVYEHRNTFTIRRTGPIAGHVLDAVTLNGIAEATVTATQSDHDFTQVTGADGAFTFPVTDSNTIYQLTASIGAIRQTQQVLAPTNGVRFLMGLPLIETVPDAIDVTVMQGESADGAAFIVRNLPAATADLRYTVEFRYDDETTAGWLAVTNGAPLAHVLAPGAEQPYQLAILSAGLAPGEYAATIHIEAIAANHPVIDIPVTLTVEETLMLEYHSFRVEDITEEDIHLGDDDGYLEPGESANVYVSLRNANPYATAFGLEATVSLVSPDDGTVTLDSNQLSWWMLSSGAVGESDMAFAVTWAPEMTAPYAEFLVDGTDALGAPFSFSFTITNRIYHSMSGLVQSINTLPLTPAGNISPVMGAVVTAEALDGTILSSTVTGADGMYAIHGLNPDEPYWIRAIPPADSSLVPPAGVSVTPSAEPDFDPEAETLAYDIMMANYGAPDKVPCLRLDGFTVSDATYGDGDGAIDPGERLEVTVSFNNNALVAAMNVTGLLVNAVFECPDCMTVVAGSIGEPAAIPPGATRPLTAAFEVQVDAAATAGSYQRFWVTAATTNTPVLAWPFDIRLDVDPRFDVHGTVTFSDGNTADKLAAVRIEARDASGKVVTTATPDPATGAYLLRGLRSGEYTILIVALPDGYGEPDPVPVSMVDGDENVDFFISPWGVQTLPDALVLEIDEGASATQALTISNLETDPALVDLHIRYARTVSGLLPAGEASALPLAANLPTDWTTLDEEIFLGDRLEIRFRDGVSMAEREAYLQRHGLEAVFHYTLVPAVLARPKAGTLAKLGGATALAEPETVAYMQPSVRLTRDALPSDPFLDELWGLRNVRQTGGTQGADISAEGAWDRSTGADTIIVAVCDTGVMINHEDLEANIWVNPGETGIDEKGRDKATNGIDDDGNGYVDDVNGWNVANWNNDVSDVDGHGTHVAGTIGAVGDNGLGVCGVNWRVRIMPVRFVDDGGSFASSADLAKGLEYAIVNGAHVSNHSWSGPTQSGVLYEMIQRAMASNHLVVCSAGNVAKNLDNNPVYPAAYSRVLDNVITVAAADHDDRLASFSSYGAESVHLAAPGVDIFSTVPGERRNPEDLPGGALAAGDGTYGWSSGTSMATPHVAGAAALLWSLSPEAGFDVIKGALLEGVRADPDLHGWVKTGGHLDLAQAIGCLGRDWLLFDDPNATADRQHLSIPSLAAGSSYNTTLTVNDPPVLTFGTYEASILVNDREGLGNHVIPVTLTVNPRALPVIDSIEVLDDADGDGYPEPGESASLRIVLRNAGSASIDDLKATLGSTTCNYGYLGSRDIAQPDGVYPVDFPAAPATNALFTLMVYDGTTLVAQVPVSVALRQAHAISGTVVGPDSQPVGGARVEVTGPYGTAAVTAADGTFQLTGLPEAGDYDCRVMADGYARRSLVVTAPAEGLVITLDEPRIARPPQRIEISVQQGMATQAVIEVANSGVSGYAFTALGANRARVGLFADGNGLGTLEPVLGQMGFAVDRYTNNFSVTHYFNPISRHNEIVQLVNYTWDDALLLNYAFVIIDLAGAGGAGRPIYDDEVAAYARYLERGGKLLITGVNPLSRPDNRALADLLELGDDACDRVGEPGGQMIMAQAAGTPFVNLDAGDRVAVAPGSRDIATPAPNGTALTLAGHEASAKIVRKTVGDTGAVMLWTGNADSADWHEEGALQDLLRAILWEALVAGEPVSWLEAAPAAGTVAPGASSTITITLNGDRQLEPGRYDGNLLLLGNADSEEVLPTEVVLTVTEPTFSAHNRHGQVLDWGGRPLPGNGGEGSCLIQILWVGTNGVPDAPQADGSPGGDDWLLTASDTGATFGYFGSGDEIVPDSGTFDVRFDHFFEPGTPGIVLYARAWDAASFASAMAYGDSTVRYTLRYLPGESADFGSWVVDQAVSPFRDTNGDSIPDLWTIGFRPDLDPRAPIEPLEPEAITTGTNNIPTGMGTAPARVVVAEKFLFILEHKKHRLSVYTRDTRQLVAYYGRTGGNGTAGSGDGEFHFPLGMGADPRPGQYRFAVADSSNHRIQVFTYNPDTGAVAFERKFGTQSAAPSATAPNGTFTRPRAVTIMGGSGDIVVADSGNQRLQKFNAKGTHKTTYRLDVAGNVQTCPEGICYDKYNGVDGVWVADSDPTKYRIAFYALPHSTTPLTISPVNGTIIGGFSFPTDVQVWQIGARKRLCVADSDNHRIRVLDMDGTVLMDFGNNPDGQRFEQLTRPYGVTPVNGTPVVYVADQDDHKVIRYNLVLDGDGDGMNDFWEDANGLDSTRNDALEDADGDGLLNIGEYRAGTDPQNPDTDGDGGGDLFEMVNLTDPLDPSATAYAPAVLQSLVAQPKTVEPGVMTTLTATFDRLPTNTVSLRLLTGEGVVVRTLELLPDGGTTLSALLDTTGMLPGWYDGELYSPDMDPPVFLADDLFEIAEPSPTANWVPYPFSNIRQTQSDPQTFGLFWRDDAKPDVGAIETYKIEHTSSLTPTNWHELRILQRTCPYGETMHEVPTDGLHPTHNFFRLFRQE